MRTTAASDSAPQRRTGFAASLAVAGLILVAAGLVPPPSRLKPRSIRLEFDQPLHARGLSDPEDSRTWTTEPRVDIDLTLASGPRYAIEFRVVAAMAPDILSSLELRVNAEPITLESTSDGEQGRFFRGTIPASAVDPHSGITRLSFTTNRVASPKTLGAADDPRALGVMFDWLRIKPEKRR